MSKKRIRGFKVEFPVRESAKWKELMPKIRSLGPDKATEVFDGKSSAVTDTPEERLERDFAYRAMRAKLKDKESLYDALVKKYERLQKDFDTSSAIRNTTNLGKDFPDSTFDLSRKPRKRGSLIPIVQFSDWHIEERVDPQTVNGLNEYNLDIANSRVHALVTNTINEVEKYRLHSEIKEIIIHLGGDSISGYIHPELEQTNQLSPIDAIIHVKDLLIVSINTLLEKGGFDKIIFLCNKGNHTRTTTKMQYNNEEGTSLEHFLYDTLRVHYASESRIEFHNPKAGIGYYRLQNGSKSFTIRYFHGQQLKSGGGVGGITVPLNKFLMRLDSTEPADFNLLGHFHTLTYGKNFVVNGSLVGYNAFALQHGFSYEPPQQSFMIYDVDKNMITNMSFILCQ